VSESEKEMDSQAVNSN